MAKKKQSAETPEPVAAPQHIYVITVDHETLILNAFEDVPDDYTGDVQVYSLVKVGKVKITRSLE